MLTGLMRLPQVRGGIHPQYNKDRSGALMIRRAPIPKRLYLPLRQHAGADAIPIVNIGDKVLKGQLIAIPPSLISAPVHASSSGTVVDIAMVTAPHPSGLSAKSIIIETDGEDRWTELEIPDDPYSKSAEDLAEIVANAGIVGLGGAIFPASVKLKQGARHEIKTLLVNGSECEPYLTCDDRIMREHAEEIVEGARLIRHILRAYRVVIAIENNKPEAIAAMQEASEPYGMIEVEVVPTRYPMGSAKQLIQEITGREVPAGGRSTEVGVLVHNVGTVLAIQQAIKYGRPLISRVITIAGGCVKSPRNVEALLGTPIKELFDFCGGLTKEPAKLVLGGPMMGVPLQTIDVPMIKGATGVLALADHEVPRSESSPCIRCGRCVNACPMGLLPLDMAAHARNDDLDGAQDYGLRDCILCGSCSYVCPAHIPLVQYFQYAKGELWDQRSAARKSDYTKAMQAAKDARKEAEAAAKAAAKAAKEAEKEAKKQARLKKQAAAKAKAAETPAADTADSPATDAVTEENS